MQPGARPLARLALPLLLPFLPMSLAWAVATAACLVSPLAFATAVDPTPPQSDCALSGPFYMAVSESLPACLVACIASTQCGGFTFKSPLSNTGEPSPPGEGNCTGGFGQPCCYMQTMDAMGAQSPRLNYSCWEKPLRPGAAIFDLGGGGAPVTPFPHFWEKGINSPNSALTLRADYQRQMTALHDDIGYTYTRIHAPFSREYSVSQGPPLPGAPANSSGTTSYFNAFATYDFLLSIGMKPWIELGYTPCWMSGPPAVPSDSYWPVLAPRRRRHVERRRGRAYPPACARISKRGS